MAAIKRTAVVLTAIGEEYNAVRAFLDAPAEEDDEGTLFEVGRFAETGTAPWRVAVAELGEGTDTAAAVTERAIRRFRPELVMFVGVAGGIKDVALGDVVAATKVYGYETGKDAQDFAPRPDLGRTTHRLAQRARAVARRNQWQARIRGDAPLMPPKGYVKPIASGNKVVASTRSVTCRFLRKQYGDALAVEMEGIGFFKAVDINTGIQAIEIRAISDLLDQKAETDEAGWQPRAAAHAAAFAFEMLAQSSGAETTPKSRSGDESHTGAGHGFVTALPSGSATLSRTEYTEEAPMPERAQIAITERPPPVYVSYAHAGDAPLVVDRFRDTCRACGIDLYIDTERMAYGDSIRRYMQRLGAAGAILVVLDDHYLKSDNCMFELLEIEKNRDFHRRAYPVVLRGTPLFKPVDRIPYLRHWEGEAAKLEKGILRLGQQDHIGELHKALNLYRDIRRLIDRLMGVLGDLNAIVYDIDGNTDFGPLIERLRASGAAPPTATVTAAASGQAIRAKVRETSAELLCSDVLERLRQALAAVLPRPPASVLRATSSDSAVDARAESAGLAEVLVDLPIDAAIETLGKALDSCLEFMEPDDPHLPGLRAAVGRVFGWLLLLSVSDAWALDRRPRAGPPAGAATLRLPIGSDAGAEVLLARWDEKGAELAFHPVDGHVIGGGHALSGSALPLTGWENPVADVTRTIKEAIWSEVMTDEVPKVFTAKDDRELDYALGIRRRTRGKGYYLTARTAVSHDPLGNEQVLAALAEQLPSLQVVYIAAEDEDSGVFAIPEWALQIQIEQFLKLLRGPSHA